ncbi:MAG TPA: hypothetical protein VG013_09835 [Gemmataceae bacterium]|nr:hypothetical protein [Gemmataceae bacterium]
MNSRDMEQTANSLASAASGATPPRASGAAASRTVMGMMAVIYVAVVALHTPPLLWPMIEADDFSILEQSWTWQATWENLWVPANEHAMPLGRLSTWALVRLAGRPTLLPLALACQGLLAVVAATGLLYLFVRRELGHPVYGLVAMILFGISTVYAEVVCWFSSSFGILALDMLVLALLAAQRWRQTGRRPWLVLSAFWSAVAPAWFAWGILAGPLCCLYLLLWCKPKTAPRSAVSLSPRLLVSLSFSPLLGSAAFLAVSLPLTADRIMHLEHYSGQTALEAFHPLTGLWYTARSLVDNLVVGFAGIPWVVLPPAAVVLGVCLVAGAAAWWWRQAPERGLLVLGLAFILTNYLLIYSARSTWSYDQMHAWSRYHLLPQLGLALFVCGGLPRWQARWHIGPAATLSSGQVNALGLLAGVLLLVNFPRGVLETPAYHQGEMEVLRRIEAVDARCREYHISADAARAALPRLPVPDWDDQHNGWVFLRGSDDPRPIRPEEARRLLER